MVGDRSVVHPGLARLFLRKPLIGVIHLPPLPGAPRYGGSMQKIMRLVWKDFEALEGVDGIIVENFFDAPFFPDHVGPETVAAMACITTQLISRVSLMPFGVNV